jgi:hypothetical protein
MLMFFTMPPADVPPRVFLQQPTVIVRASGGVEVRWLGEAPEHGDDHHGHPVGHPHVTDVTTPGVTSAIRGSLPTDHSFMEPGAASSLATTVGAWIAAPSTQPTFNLRALERAADQRARAVLHRYSQPHTWRF